MAIAMLSLKISRRWVAENLHNNLPWSDLKNQVLKSEIEVLRDKPFRNRRLVFFHEFLDSSQIHRPPAQGKHTVIIVIKGGPGFPRISKGSHLVDITTVSTTSMEDIPQENGLVVVYDAGMACQYPAVKGVGGYGILLLY